MTDGISFTSQVHNTETRSLVWEKGKPYVVVTTGGCYWWGIFCKLVLQHCRYCGSFLWKWRTITESFFGYIVSFLHEKSYWCEFLVWSWILVKKRTLTFPVISRVAIGAFSKKTSTPPSLQVTTDEEPVTLVWLNHLFRLCCYSNGENITNYSSHIKAIA